MKLILRGLSFCLHSFQTLGFWPSPLSFFGVTLCVEVQTQNAIELWYNWSAVAGVKYKPRSWNIKSCWVMNSQFSLDPVEEFRDVHVKLHMSSKVVQKGGKKRGKRVHWVTYKVSGNTFLLARLRLKGQLEIHIRGLRVWSMSCWITTAGEVNCQTGPGHWVVLKTSLRYLINRIKISVQGLFWAFGRENQRRLECPSKCFRDGGRTQTGGFKEDSVGHDLESDSSNPALEHKK